MFGLHYLNGIGDVYNRSAVTSNAEDYTEYEDCTEDFKLKTDKNMEERNYDVYDREGDYGRDVCRGHRCDKTRKLLTHSLAFAAGMVCGQIVKNIFSDKKKSNNND